MLTPLSLPPPLPLPLGGSWAEPALTGAGAGAPQRAGP